jgi:hypothetical protein
LQGDIIIKFQHRNIKRCQDFLEMSPSLTY